MVYEVGDNTGPVPKPYWFDPLNVKYDGDGDVNVGEFTRVMFSCGDTKSYHTLPEPEYDAGLLASNCKVNPFVTTLE